MSDHVLFGRRVRSALPLDELAPWEGDDRAPDIAITLGAVAPELATAAHRGPFLQVAQNGNCQLTIAGVARYHVEGGRSVVIDPAGAADTPDVMAFLLGSVLGILAHQNGLLPLHASAVRIGGRAVAFAGISGGGKSTLAATLARRGHVLLADDVAAIEPAADGPLLWPSFPRLKLWGDSLAALGIDHAGLARVRAAQDKFKVAPARFDAAPVRLSAVYGLATARGPLRPGIVPVTGRAAVALLSANVYRASLGPLLGRQPAIFAALMRIAQGASIHALTRPDDLGAIEDVAAWVEDHVATRAADDADHAALQAS